MNHEYKKSIVYIRDLKGYFLCEYCIKCNEIKDIIVISESNRLLTNEEILKKYNNLPIKELESLDSDFEKEEEV